MNEINDIGCRIVNRAVFEKGNEINGLSLPLARVPSGGCPSGTGRPSNADASDKPKDVEVKK